MKLLGRILLTLVAVVLSAAALAQTPPRVNCVTQTCTIVSDALAAVPANVPTLCRLYSGSTRLAEVPAVAPFACSFTRNFAAGSWSLTARYANATEEGPDSNVLTFVSGVPLPPPANLRFQ